MRTTQKQNKIIDQINQLNKLIATSQYTQVIEEAITKKRNLQKEYESLTPDYFKWLNKE